MALVKPSASYTSKTFLALVDGVQEYHYYFKESVTSYSATVRPVVVIGENICPIGEEREFAMIDMDYGDIEYITFRQAETIADPEGLLELFAANGVCGAQVMLQYTANNADETESGLLEVPNLYIIDRKREVQINDLSVYRSENGEEVDDGVEIIIEARLTISDVTNIGGYSLGLYYAENADATEESDYVELLSSVTEPEQTVSIVVNEADFNTVFSNSSDWGLLLRFGDVCQYVTVPTDIFKAFANLHLSGKRTGGVCMGGFSKSEEGSPMFECHYPAYFYGGIMQGGSGAKDYPQPGVEQDTGVKWYDGRPVYRMVLELGKLSASSNVKAYMNCGALSRVLSVNATGVRGTTTIRLLPHVGTSASPNAWITVEAWSSDNPYVQASSNSTGAMSDIVAVIEYTKAADAAE